MNNPHCECYEPPVHAEGRPMFDLEVDGLSFEGRPAITFHPDLGLADRRRIEEVLLAVRLGEGPAQGIW